MKFFRLTQSIIFFFFIIIVNAYAVGSSEKISAVASVLSSGSTEQELLECIVEPFEQISVSSEVPGVIDRYYIERGDYIRRGQKLVALRAGLQAAAVALAKSKVEFGQKKVIRNKELLEKELISEQENDELEIENRIAELELKEMQEKLKMRTIYSPIRGVVVDRHNSSGEYVAAEPVLTIAQVDPLNVEVIVPVEKFGTIKKGMRADVFPVIPSGSKVVGKVIIVDSVIDAASGTFGVRIQVPNKKRQLAAGVKCQVKFSK